MARYDDLPAEVIVRIAACLCSGINTDVSSFLCLSLVSASTRAALNSSQQLWRDAYSHSWLFENAGLRGRTADLYNRNDPQVFPGCKPALEVDTPCLAFRKRQQKDIFVHEALESMVRTRAGRVGKGESIVKMGADAADCLLFAREIAKEDGNLEKIYWCDKLLQCISSSIGDRLLRQICAHPMPKASSWQDDTQYVPEALDALYAIATYHHSLGVLPAFNVEDLIGDIAKDVLYEWDHQGCCNFPFSGELNCVCFKDHDMSSVFGLVLETMHDNDLCVDHVLPCEFPDLESNFISDSLLGRKPASPIVFTVIFCAVAKRIGLLAAPIVVGDFVMAKICYKQDGSNRERFMDVCNDGQLFTIKALYELLQPYGATREMVLEGSKAIQGPMLVKYCAHSIFECLQGDSSNLIDYLAVVRCFHWCDHPTDIVPLNIAYILGEMDHFSTTTWLEVLPQLAKLSGYTKENARHASEVLQAFQNVKNHALSVARRSNPERAIRFALGSLVRHRKHKYLGVIHGHDDECKQSQKWQEEMRVSKLKGGGPNQPFYYIRKTDGLDMYVAERNLEIVSCDRCGDRQADVNNGSKVLDADYLPCIMKLERLPSESNLGQIVKARKNKGACGYVPGSDIQQQYPASLWPPMPNACSQRSKP